MQQPQQQVVVVQTGSCPQCHMGNFEDSFTCCGITMAIIFFPVGLLCCWFMRERKCTNCGFAN